MKHKLFLMAFLMLSAEAGAQQIHGTLRGKYEYQTAERQGRFQVRNARVNITGNISEAVAYKAEVDLCDEGKIKMLDAYTQVRPLKDSRLAFTIGQMRVPFTIDAHRSPHLQYFANRSFIAKQVGNVRDVGAKLGYTFNVGVPLTVEAGIFNGSGLTGQKDFWTSNINFSGKMRMDFPRGFSLTLSCQKTRPDDVSVMSYDIGAYWHARGWHVEGEYLYKHYAHGAFRGVHAVNSFVSYDFPVRHRLIKKITPLMRYDMMTDHSDGERKEQSDGTWALSVDDYARHRLTTGLTLSLEKPFISDIRLNFERYYYPHGGVAKTSEKDKIVVEFMTHF